MPTSMDQGVATLRQWLTNKAGPIPWGVEDPDDVWSKDYTRHEMLDRYNQHTKHCKNCSKVRHLQLGFPKVVRLVHP